MNKKLTKKAFKGEPAIAAGDDHTVVLKDDGTVWAFGSNRYGQLCDGTSKHKSTPVEVLGLSDVKAIAAGLVHTVALKTTAPSGRLETTTTANGVMGRRKTSPRPFRCWG